jgi:hypothetical protein
VFRELLIKIKLSRLKNLEQILFNSWLINKNRGDNIEQDLKLTRAKIKDLEIKIIIKKGV